MKVDVLISCMHEQDLSITQRSGLAGSAVIVNQCDTDGTLISKDGAVRMTMTTQRGLSRSRNMAIGLSDADICLISDNDEVYTDGYVDILRQSYATHPEADIILFQVGNAGKKYRDMEMNVGYLRALRFASWQISFRRDSIIKAGVCFDEKMGSGTGNGSGEEIKFLFDCLHKGLRLVYVPVQIASLDKDSSSQWFHGFTDEYFVNRGWATARYMGRFPATIYGAYYAIRKYPQYKRDNNMVSAFWNILKGIYLTTR